MKKTQLLPILILSGTIAFGAQETAQKTQVYFQKSLNAESITKVKSNSSTANLVIDSEQAIHGLQFDIEYNPSEIKSITPQAISGFEVKYNELSDGLIRGLVFSFQGNALPKSLPFEFKYVEGYDGNSTIKFKDIILADKQGTRVDTQLPSSWDTDNAGATKPFQIGLSKSYPNPFNPTTKIEYGFQNDGYVEIMIYDATGRLVDELVSGYQKGGITHSITWNASNQASGMYFAKMVAGDMIETQKLVLLK